MLEAAGDRNHAKRVLFRAVDLRPRFCDEQQLHQPKQREDDAT
jgi:hypothetical protein